ncbi:MAG: NTP transferase domain-containing protein [Thiobacillaceae bacterium]|nr:NTP transferase domain-containing protein [Thiobacillaceae bacterium]
MSTVGLVLAAGESRRMGQPKALLQAADGVLLAAQQAAVLRAGGCAPVGIVLGSEADTIRARLPQSLTTVINPGWAQGRMTSLQAGIRAYPQATGYLFLPVDTVGVAVKTVTALLAAARAAPTGVWRPVYRGAKGNILWLSPAAGADLLALPPDARVDEWARSRAQELEVGDAAILCNVNTPEDWALAVSVRRATAPEPCGRPTIGRGCSVRRSGWSWWASAGGRREGTPAD